MSSPTPINPGNSAETILSVLAESNRIVVDQDGTTFDSAWLRKSVQTIENSLRETGCPSVSLQTSRSELVLTALLASTRNGVDLHLQRSTDSISNRHHRGATLQEDLSLCPAPGGIPPVNLGGKILLETSGTTAEPRLVARRFESLMGRISPGRRMTGENRWLLAYPAASFAGIQVMLTSVVSRSVLLTVSHPSLNNWMTALLTRNPTHVSATPTFWRAVLAGTGDKTKLPRLTQITLGGEPASQDLLDQLKQFFPDAGLMHIYASTEAGAVFAVKDGKEGFPVEWLDHGVEGARLRICRDVLEIAGPREMDGYVTEGGLTNPPETGWIRTGDQVKIVGNRVLFCGREDHIISVGGAKVSPEEVENGLMKLPWIQDALVYGIKNPITGFVTGADLVVSPGMDEFTAKETLLKSMSGLLEPHKIPRFVRIVPTIPTSPSGKKIRKNATIG